MAMRTDHDWIGNQLERGEIRVDDCCYVNLRRIRNPLLIFASCGDNITPPHQALNWIPTVYSSTGHLKAAGQRIVYLINTHLGHLGLFVSADVARQEHRAILENVDRLDGLAPGLYEMKIDRPAPHASPDERRLAVHFEEREVEQIRNDYPKAEFEKVRVVSEWNELAYQRFVSPWVSFFASPLGAEFQKWWHPLRSTKLAFSDRINPWMWPVAGWASVAQAQRRTVAQKNPFAATEQAASAIVYQAMDGYRRLRDAWSEQLFTLVYGIR